MAEAIEDAVLLAMLRDPLQLEKGMRLLMSTYQQRLYQHLFRMLQSHEDTDDVMQNTFIKVYRSIGNFKEQSSLFTWLYKIGTNEALTMLANVKKKSTTELTDDHSIFTNNGMGFDEEEALRKLHFAIETLPEKQKLVFQMRYYDEMNYQQMSEILDTSVGALKASYHHAIKRIESMLIQ